MTRPRRKGHRLTEGQLKELSSAMHLLIEGRSAFSSDDDRQRAWCENRDEVRRFYRQHYSQYSGPEPPAWHAYDAPPEDRRTLPEVPYSND